MLGGEQLQKAHKSLETIVDWTSSDVIPAGSTEQQRDAILDAMVVKGDTSDDAGDQLGDCCNATRWLIECPNEKTAYVMFSGTVGRQVCIKIGWHGLQP